MSADWVNTAKYLSLTTFRRDGTPVATPVWFAIDSGGRLVIYSVFGAGKIKRVRANVNVEVSPCTLKGRLTGIPVGATAVELGGSDAEAAKRALNKKYGLQKRILDWSTIVGKMFQRGTPSPDGYLAITLPD